MQKVIIIILIISLLISFKILYYSSNVVWDRGFLEGKNTKYIAALSQNTEGALLKIFFAADKEVKFSILMKEGYNINGVPDEGIPFNITYRFGLFKKHSFKKHWYLSESLKLNREESDYLIKVMSQHKVVHISISNMDMPSEKNKFTLKVPVNFLEDLKKLYRRHREWEKEKNEW